MAKVIAPNKHYTGLSAGVMFNNGIGETDDVNRIKWFAQKGYLVEGYEADASDLVPTATDTVSREEHEAVIAAHKASLDRVADLEKALAIANEEIERLQPKPPEPAGPVEPAPEPEPEKPNRKGK